MDCFCCFCQLFHRLIFEHIVTRIFWQGTVNFHFHNQRTCFESELIRRNTNTLIVQNRFEQSDVRITNICGETDAELMREEVK